MRASRYRNRLPWESWQTCRLLILAWRRQRFLSGFTLTIQWVHDGCTCNDMCYQLHFAIHCTSLCMCVCVCLKSKPMAAKQNIWVYCLSMLRGDNDEEAECHGSADRHLWSWIQANLLTGGDKLERLSSDASCRITNVMPDHGRFGEIAVVRWNNGGSSVGPRLLWPVATARRLAAALQVRGDKGWEQEKQVKVRHGWLFKIAFGKCDQLSGIKGVFLNQKYTLCPFISDSLLE